MNIKLKYPQQFKKQHKKRTLQLPTNLNPNLDSQSKGISSYKMTSNFQYICIPTQSIILPKKFISFLRKFLRKFFKRHHICCWFRIQLNKVISSKSKNSRMGRGVGTINRTAFQIFANKPLFIISNISSKRLMLLTKFLSKRLPIKLLVFPQFFPKKIL